MSAAVDRDRYLARALDAIAAEYLRLGGDDRALYLAAIDASCALEEIDRAAEREHARRRAAVHRARRLGLRLIGGGRS